ncbi:hypothetical protein C4588_07550 [Candidatus Parcubacteria bacterium]|jgi:hypothetical protein|nr:MAG: hypothetical protein C4588_07550 [Candidatus Parcubacteria bacterium]
MQLFLSKEEKFHVESIAAKRNNLALQDQLLQNEMDGVIAEFCKRNSVDMKTAKTLNVEQGFIEFEEPKKLDNKKEKKIKSS